MRHVWIALLVMACGSKQPPPAPRAVPPDAAAQPDDCPKHVDCMPPLDEPCPPPGLKERCPNTMITH